MSYCIPVLLTSGFKQQPSFQMVKCSGKSMLLSTGGSSEAQWGMKACGSCVSSFFELTWSVSGKTHGSISKAGWVQDAVPSTDVQNHPVRLPPLSVQVAPLALHSNTPWHLQPSPLINISICYTSPEPSYSHWGWYCFSLVWFAHHLQDKQWVRTQ